jgi:CDP-glycerol glycerophosphotransferase
MPFLSVVLPCYGVEDYLDRCLDSILDPPSADLEVIAVDDASPDRCPRILDERAVVDPRLHVIHLAENVGLGRARNIGLDHATGRYVMFVDSDDYLTDGAVAAIAAKLEEAEPDILFFDHVRLLPSGATQANPRGRLLRDLGTADLRRRPSAMDLSMVAWNKAFRREFLVGLDLRFRKGYYEDIPLTYPALMTAARIATLDRICYVYRERRGASITQTPSQRHFDVFDQYRAVFDFMGTRDDLDDLRAEMFRRMLWHYVGILVHPDRMSPRDRARFFARVVDDFDRYRPAGYRHPPGKEGWKYRLVERRAYRTLRMLAALKAIGRRKRAA